MTPFTDENLKMLKESLEAQLIQHPGPSPILGLIHRLEAAEKIAEGVVDEHNGCVDDKCFMAHYINAWRKAAEK